MIESQDYIPPEHKLRLKSRFCIFDNIANLHLLFDIRKNSPRPTTEEIKALVQQNYDLINISKQDLSLETASCSICRLKKPSSKVYRSPKCEH